MERAMPNLKFDDYSTGQVAELLGVTRQTVMTLCRKHGWGYRLGPTRAWRVPRERLERILADREAAARTDRDRA
jgi:excisionase family DNA binding protein